MDAKSFDKKFADNKVDIVDDLHVSTATRPNQALRQIALDLSAGMVAALDREAARLGITRGNLIRQWLADKLE